MKRTLAMAYSAAAYLLFFLTFLYLIAFVGNWFVPKSIDTGTPVSLAEALLVNVGLIALFGIQHTIMARQKFKDWWTRYVPAVAERSTFVVVASLIFLLMFWQWRAMPTVLWSVEQPVAAGLLIALSLTGWGILLYTSFLINHFELFGLQQGWNYLTGRQAVEPTFRKPQVYKYSRHPMMLGVAIAIWATPVMTVGHLVFALTFSAYILIGTRFEERELVQHLGDAYREYQRTTPMLIPGFGPRASASPAVVKSQPVERELALSGTER